jgi:mannitol/fructose-specific phosphotransferase system IIA component (Ntr-type)
VCEAGVDFDAPDGQPAHILFLIVTPAEDPTIQLDLAASVGRLFRDGRTLERLLRAANFTEFLATVRMLEPKAPADEPPPATPNAGSESASA